MPISSAVYNTCDKHFHYSTVVHRYQCNQVTEAVSIRELQEAVEDLIGLGNDNHCCILQVRSNSKQGGVLPVASVPLCLIHSFHYNCTLCQTHKDTRSTDILKVIDAMYC